MAIGCDNVIAVSEVESEMRAMRSAVSYVECDLDVLVDRLEVVLVPSNPMCGENGAKDGIPRQPAPLVGDIRMMLGNVASIHDRLSDIIERLAL